MTDEPQTDWAIESTPPPRPPLPQASPSDPPPSTGASAASAPSAASRRRTGLVVGVVVGTLLLVAIGLLASLVFGPRGEVTCDAGQSSCRLTLTGRGAQVDLATTKGHRLIRHDGIDGPVAALTVEGQDQTCRAGQVLHVADLSVRCDQITDDTLTLTVRH